MVLDGNFISGATIAVAVLALFIRPSRKFLRKHQRCWSSQKAITDLLNGSSLVPFLCLFWSAFDPRMLPLILENKAAMCIAGGIGSIFIAGEILAAGRDDPPGVSEEPRG